MMNDALMQEWQRICVLYNSQKHESKILQKLDQGLSLLWKTLVFEKRKTWFILERRTWHAWVFEKWWRYLWKWFYLTNILQIFYEKNNPFCEKGMYAFKKNVEKWSCHGFFFFFYKGEMQNDACVFEKCITPFWKIEIKKLWFFFEIKVFFFFWKIFHTWGKPLELLLLLFF